VGSILEKFISAIEESFAKLASSNAIIGLLVLFLMSFPLKGHYSRYKKTMLIYITKNKTLINETVFNLLLFIVIMAFLYYIEAFIHSYRIEKNYSKNKDIANALSDKLIQDYIMPISNLVRLSFSLLLIFLTTFNLTGFYPFYIFHYSFLKLVLLFIYFLLTLIHVLPPVKNFFWKSFITNE